MLLAWPHATTWPDHIPKLLLLLRPNHHLPNIPLTRLLHQLELPSLLLWVLPHYTLPRLHNLHHLGASLPRTLPYSHKSLGRGSRTSGTCHVVLLGS